MQIERRVHHHSQECQHPGNGRQGIGKYIPVHDSALLCGNNFRHGQGMMLSGKGNNRQGERHFRCGGQRQTAHDTHCREGMPAFTGTQGHPQHTEENEINNENDIPAETEILKPYRPENSRHKQIDADTAGQPENRPQVEHDAV